MNRARKLERKLDKIVGDRDNIALGELFAAVGIDAVRGRAAVEHAIDHGYFGPMPTSTTAPTPLSCAGLHPSRPRNRSRSRKQNRKTVCLPSAAAAPRQRVALPTR